MNYPKSDGVLFPNERKQSPNHPDYKGTLTLTGDQIRMIMAMVKAGEEPKLQIAAWHKTAQSSGRQYMSLSAEAYSKAVDPATIANGAAPQRQAPPPPPPPPAQDSYDDDIPF